MPNSAEPSVTKETPVHKPMSPAMAPPPSPKKTKEFIDPIVSAPATGNIVKKMEQAAAEKDSGSASPKGLASFGKITPWTVVFKNHWPGSISSLRKKQRERVVELIEQFVLEQ
ncbi:hypothetical protein HDU91_005096, partial [Kappamyces sp. JEL0680]